MKTLIILSLFIGLFLFFASKDHFNDERPSNPPAQATVTTAMDSLRDKALKSFDKKIKSKKEEVFQTNDRYDRYIIAKQKALLKEVKGVQNNIIAQEAINLILDEFIETKDDVDSLSNHLTDVSNTRKEFGENQALMRIMSIKGLSRLAKKTDLEPLKKTIEKLALIIASRKYDDKGQDRDFEDLIQAYVNVRIDDVKDNIKTVLSSIRLNSLVSDQLYLGVFRALNAHFDHKTTDAILYSYFGGPNEIL